MGTCTIGVSEIFENKNPPTEYLDYFRYFRVTMRGSFRLLLAALILSVSLAEVTLIFVVLCVIETVATVVLEYL